MFSEALTESLSKENRWICLVKARNTVPRIRFICAMLKCSQLIGIPLTLSATEFRQFEHHCRLHMFLAKCLFTTGPRSLSLPPPLFFSSLSFPRSRGFSGSFSPHPIGSFSVSYAPTIIQQ